MELQRHDYFSGLVDQHYLELKAEYLDKVEQADNESYAKEYYRASIFERNTEIPVDSHFFSTLSRVFLHYFRLKKESALENTMNDLHLVRERSELVLDATIDEYAKFPEKPLTYFEGNKIESESHLLSLEMHELVDLLALFLANRKLLEEFPKNEKFDPFSLDAPILEEKTTHNRKHEATVVFTESHQALAIHFFLEQDKIHTRKDHSLADFARMAHLLSRTPITKIDNSPKLSAIKRLLNSKSKHPSLKDLEFILPFFENIGKDEAVNLIKLEIKAKKDDL